MESISGAGEGVPNADMGARLIPVVAINDDGFPSEVVSGETEVVEAE